MQTDGLSTLQVGLLLSHPDPDQPHQVKLNPGGMQTVNILQTSQVSQNANVQRQLWHGIIQEYAANITRLIFECRIYNTHTGIGMDEDRQYLEKVPCHQFRAGMAHRETGFVRSGGRGGCSPILKPRLKGLPFAFSMRCKHEFPGTITPGSIFNLANGLI